MSFIDWFHWGRGEGVRYRLGLGRQVQRRDQRLTDFMYYACDHPDLWWRGGSVMWSNVSSGHFFLSFYCAVHLRLVQNKTVNDIVLIWRNQFRASLVCLAFPSVFQYFMLLLFVAQSLEIEFVHQGQISPNVFNGWSCTLSGTQRFLPLEYDI